MSPKSKTLRSIHHYGIVRWTLRAIICAVWYKPTMAQYTWVFSASSAGASCTTVCANWGTSCYSPAVPGWSGWPKNSVALWRIQQSTGAPVCTSAGQVASLASPSQQVGAGMVFCNYDANAAATCDYGNPTYTRFCPCAVKAPLPSISPPPPNQPPPPRPSPPTPPSPPPPFPPPCGTYAQTINKPKI